MSTQVQRRKGTTVQHSTFTGASAELTVDTTKNTVVVHDGATAGGIPLAKETGSAISAASLTLPNGTANAVAFLNGSKVLTSGTALTFDGTTLGTTGALRIDGNVTLGDASTNTVQVNGYVGVGGAASAGHGIYFNAVPNSATFASAITTNFIIPATTTSYAASFQSNISAVAGSYTTPNVYGFIAGNMGAIGAGATVTNLHGFYVADQTRGTNNYGITSLVSSGTNKWNIYASGTAQNYFAGNVGIGTTSPGAKLDVNGSAAFRSTVFVDRATTGANAIINFSTALTYDWQIYTVATATPALAFGISGGAEKMRLDSSGNLGVGTTSPAALLHLSSGNGTKAIWGTTRSFTVNRNWQVAVDEYAEGQFTITPSTTLGGTTFTTPAIRLDASGNLQLSTSANDLTLQIGPTTPSATRSGRIALTTSSTQKNWFIASNWNTIGGLEFTQSTAAGGSTMSSTPSVVLDASGNLLVGQTVRTNPNSNSFDLDVTLGALYQNHVSGTSSGSAYTNLYYNSALIGSITQSGTTAVLYNVTSDQRLKENIQDAAPASALIDSLQVRQYDWKSDGSHQRYGFIAQELVVVAPEAVHQPADPEEMMAVDYSKLVPMLVKELQSLRARVASLESK